LKGGICLTWTDDEQALVYVDVVKMIARAIRNISDYLVKDVTY